MLSFTFISPPKKLEVQIPNFTDPPNFTYSVKFLCFWQLPLVSINPLRTKNLYLVDVVFHKSSNKFILLLWNRSLYYHVFGWMGLHCVIFRKGIFCVMLFTPFTKSIFGWKTCCCKCLEIKKHFSYKNLKWPICCSLEL